MTSPRASTDDRRRSVRVDALGRVPVISLSRQMRATLHDVSIDGFAVKSPESLEVGESHRFEFRFPSSHVRVDATCRHVERTVFSTAPTYLAVFVFDALEGRARDVVMTFIDQQLRRQSLSADGPVVSWSGA